MKNIKIENGYVGHEYWPNVAFVDLKGKPKAAEFPRDGTEDEMEVVIQSWDDVAVLKVTPVVPIKFGYIHGNAIHYLKEPIETTTDGMFAVRIGDDDIRFFVLPISLDQDMKLEVVEVTKENDPKYDDLPLY